LDFRYRAVRAKPTPHAKRRDNVEMVFVLVRPRA
jgi:hypothetical protein